MSGMRAALLALSVLAALPAFAQLDETCTVSILNRTARVRPDGTWRIDNVPAGLGKVRARATCVRDGVTVSGQSGFFEITANTINGFDAGIVLGSVDPAPESLSLSSPVPELSSDRRTVQLTVIARYSDGRTADVSAASAGTTYTVSNPAVATVTPDGLLTVARSGTVVVSAMNDGALAVLQLRAVLSPDSDGDGIPDDREVREGLDPSDPLDALADLDSDGLSNRREVEMDTGLREPDSDGDGLRDGEEVDPVPGLPATSPVLADTDGDQVRDGLELRKGTDPTDPASVDYAAVATALALVPARVVLTVSTALPAEVGRRLRLAARLEDGTVADLARVAVVSWSTADPLVAGFGAEPGRVYAGRDGTATIAAALGTLRTEATIEVVTVQPRALSFVPLPGFAGGVGLDGSQAWVAAGGAGLLGVDVSDPVFPRRSGSVKTPGNANDVRVAGGFAFVADGAAGLTVADVRDPARPRIAAGLDTPGQALDVAVADGIAYVADGEAGLWIADVTDPTAPRFLASLDTPGMAQGVDVDEGFAVVADGPGGVHVIDVREPSRPVLAGSTHTRTGAVSRAADVAVRGRRAWVADGAGASLGGLVVIDFREPRTPGVLGASAGTYGLNAVAVDGDLALAADYYLVNGVPLFGLGATRPESRGVLDFSAGPVRRDDNGVGIAARDGLVFLAGNLQSLEGFGTWGNGGLHIGRYAAPASGDTGLPPSVAVTVPAAGASVREGSVLRLQARAEDDVLVGSVQFVVDGEPVFTDFTPPWDFDWVAQGPPWRTVSISARATDIGGLRATSDPVALEILGDPFPAAEILAPVSGTHVPAGVQMYASVRARDDSRVRSVRLVVNGVPGPVLTAEPWLFWWQVPAAGVSVELKAVAEDDAGQTGTSSPVVLQIDPDRPPEVRLLAPSAGAEAVAGSAIRVVAGAMDDLGVSSVRFRVDGVDKSTDSEAPYELDLLLPAQTGRMRIAAVAVDARGQTATQEVEIAVVPDPGTRVAGLALLPEGGPAAGAAVTVLDREARTDAAGRFVLEGVPTVRGLLAARVRLERSGVVLVGGSLPVPPLPNGSVDLGSITLREACWETDLGERLDLEDDQAVLVPLPFPFPFHGLPRASVYVASNGSLTFGQGDPTPEPRLPEGVVTGPARIAPLVADFDPPSAGAGGGVFVRALPDRLVVTWSGVPLAEGGGSNSVQAILFADGTLQLGWQGLTVPGGPGIAMVVTPGGLPPVRTLELPPAAPLTLAPGEAVYGTLGEGVLAVDGGFLVLRPAAGGTYEVRFFPR